MAYSGGVSVGSPPSLPGGGKGISTGYTYTNKYTLPKTPAPRPIRGGITPAPTPTITPPAPGATSASNGGTTANDPYAGLDATYAANTATNLFNTTNKINALTTQGANNEVALQSALAQLSGQQPYDQLKEMYNANRGGGLYSTVYGQNQGRIGQSYLDRESALKTNDANAQYNLQQQEAALRAGIPLYNDQERAASLARAVAALAKDPAAVVAPTTPSNTVAPNGSFSNAGTPPVAAPPTGPGTPGSLTGPSIAGTFGRGTDWYKTATRAEAASGRRAAAGYAVHPAVSALAKALVAAKGKKIGGRG